ncbi:MAG: ABC transporter permease subunit [Bdellovibrionota bacterium]
MRALVRSSEILHGTLLALGLVCPLALFFHKTLSFENTDIVALFSSPAIYNATLNSLLLSLLTALFSTILAFVFSWILWRYDWSPRLVRALSITMKTPYLLPPFFFAMGWIALAAPSVGYLRALYPDLPSIYGMSGTVFVMTLWSLAFAMIQLQVFFSQFPGHLEDAAILCGASPLQTFFRITTPLARPQLVSCFLLVSVSSLAAFGVPAMLASPDRAYVLTTRIYQSIKSDQNFSQAGWLSLLLLVITIVLLLLQRLVMKGRHAAALVSGKASRPAVLRPSFHAKSAMALICFFAVIASVLPCAALVLQSFLRDRSDVTSISLEKYIYVFSQIPDGWIALSNSLLTASVGTIIATFLGLVTAYGMARLHLRSSSWMIEAWNIGFALPGTIIALSLLVFYAGSITDTLWILGFGYLIKYGAFSARTLSPALSALSKELEEAAWMNGASPRQAFLKIVVPLLKPAIAAALLLAWVPMLSELTISVLLVGVGTETLGALIYRLQEYADPGAAAVLAVVVALATLILNGALRRVSKGSFGI